MKATTKRDARKGPSRNVAESTADGFKAIKRILVPVDFSEPGKRALRYAQGMAKQFKARLTVVHVVEPFWYPHDWNYAPGFEGRLGPAVQEREAQKELAKLAKEAVETTIPVTPHVRSGTPWHEILLAANEHKSDLIVIGTHGRTGLKHALIGSTAERVVRHARCPVLVVR